MNIALLGQVDISNAVRDFIDLSAQVGVQQSLVAMRAARRIRQILLPIVNEEAPKRTGKLVAETFATIDGDGRQVTLQVKSGADYARYVVEGTAPHLILPRNGRVLAFTVGGQQVFATRVNHPGTKPNPFTDRALEKAMPAITAAMEEETMQVALLFA